MKTLFKILLISGVCGLSESSFAGPTNDDDCRIVREGTRVALESPFFVLLLDTQAGLRATAWENRLTGQKISLGDGPELEVDLGELGGALLTPEWKVTGLPERSGRSAVAGDAVFQLIATKPALAARVAYRWDAKEPVLRKFVQITNTTEQECRLLNVRLGAYHTNGKVVDREQGFPVYLNDQFFMSLAHPAGWATGKDGEVSLRQYPGAKLAAGAAFECMETVYGVGATGQARTTFLAHVRGRMRRVLRGHDRPYAIYDNFGSWPSGAGGDWRNSEEILLRSLELLAQSQQAAGCKFDFCNIHFWVDPTGDLKRWEPTRFPNGITRIKTVLDTLGTAPGLWIDSSTTWSGGWGIGLNPAARPALSHDPGWYCRASEPIRSLFREGFLHQVRENGIRELKFDNLKPLCNNPQHDHLPGLYSTEAIENSLIEFLHDLDRERPELFLILYWGFRSPWWLLHGDTLFDSGIGIEAASPSSQPAIHARDSVTQKLDQAQWHASDVPVLGKDSLGVWLSDWGWNSSIGKERWQEGVVMDMCRGSLLLQIWADNDWLSPPEWKELADLLALLRAQPRCFGNPRFVLGNPWKDEPYGYCCTDGTRAFLALNNCTWQDRTLALELNSAWGLPDGQRWDLYRWYPRPARLKGDVESFGSKAAILLRPFDVVLLEAVPAGQRPTLERSFSVQPLPKAFAEPSQVVELSVGTRDEKEDPTLWTVLAPSSAVSAGGATLTKHADNSILAGGKNPSPDKYTIMADTMLTGITGIRLEVLDDAQLPAHGPGRAYNGNFALAEFSVTAAPADNPADARPVRLHKPSASFAQATYGGWPIAAAIDGDLKSAWSLDPREGEAQTAVFETDQPVGWAGGTTITFTLDQGYRDGPPEHTIGRLRLSVTTAKPPIPPPAAKGTQRFIVRGQSPGTSYGGTLIITAELKKDAEATFLGDIGTYFTSEAKLAGQAAKCTPVLGKATYPSCWQAWRMTLAPSATPEVVELAVDAALPPNVRCVFHAHFCPRDTAP